MFFYPIMPLAATFYEHATPLGSGMEILGELCRLAITNVFNCTIVRLAE